VGQKGIPVHVHRKFITVAVPTVRAATVILVSRAIEAEARRRAFSSFLISQAFFCFDKGLSF